MQYLRMFQALFTIHYFLFTTLLNQNLNQIINEKTQNHFVIENQSIIVYNNVIKAQTEVK